MNYVFNGHYLGKSNQYAIGKSEITPSYRYNSLRLDFQHCRTVNLPAGAAASSTYDRKIYRIDFNVDGKLITTRGSRNYTRDEAYLEEIPGTAGKYVYMVVANMPGIDSSFDTYATMHAGWYWPTYTKARTVYENCGTEISFGRTIPSFYKVDTVSIYLDSNEYNDRLYIAVHTQDLDRIIHLNYFNSISMPSDYTVEEVADGVFKHTWTWQ